MSFIRQAKYGAKRTTIDGKAFPSQLEASLYLLLKQYVALGALRDLRLQVRVDPPKCPTCQRHTASPVKVDFSAYDTEIHETVYYEAKGVELRRWKEFVKWWREDGPGLLRVYKGRPGRLICVEEITPKKYHVTIKGESWPLKQ